MKMAETYLEYATIVSTPLSEDEMALDEMESATPTEVGWQKKFQFTRAMRNARNGKATQAEIIYLARRGYYYPTTPKVLIKKPVGKLA